jgi:hypothetical protein
MARSAALRQPAVDHAYGNTAARGGLDEVRPDLELDQDDHVRLDGPQEAVDRKREVQRVAGQVMGPAKQGLGPRTPRIRGGADHDLGLQRRRDQMSEELAGGVDLPHRNRVHQDARKRPAQSVLILPVRIIRTSHTGELTTVTIR